MEIALKVEKEIKSDIEKSGFILDEVLFLKEGNSNFLRIIIDKQDAVTIDDCVLVTKLINPILDEMNINDNNYILDVCSKEKGCE